MKTEEHPEHKRIAQWKTEKLDQSISRTRWRTVGIVVIMDMVTFLKVFLVGLFVVIALTATVTLIFLS